MKKTFLALLVLFTLSGCNQEQYFYTAESENWLVKVNTNNSDSSKTDWSIKYIGEDTQPETINYKIQELSLPLNDSSTGENIRLDDNGLYKQESTSLCPNCYINKEKQELEVLIEWGDQLETLEIIHTETLH